MMLQIEKWLFFWKKFHFLKNDFRGFFRIFPLFAFNDNDNTGLFRNRRRINISPISGFLFVQMPKIASEIIEHV